MTVAAATVKIHVSNAIGPVLDWAVAYCEGYVAKGACRVLQGQVVVPSVAGGGQSYSPSTNLILGDEIVRRKSIQIVRLNDYYFPNGNEKGQHWEPAYKAMSQVVTCYGPTPLIAGMRCHVMSEMGSEIEVPAVLVAKEIA